MKIICTACGKKYDPLKKQGICPYCGMHSTEEQLAEAVENDRIQSGTVSEVLRGYFNEKLRKEQKQSPLRKKGVQLMICLGLVACMGLVGLWGYFRYKDRLAYYREQRNTEGIQVVQCSQGDEVVLMGTAFRVLGCREVKEFTEKTEGGFRIIEVTYSDSGADYYQRMSDAYMLTENGTTAACLTRYEIMDLTGMSEDQYRDSDYREGFFSTGEHQRGEYKILFAVPEKETEHKILLFRITDKYADDKNAEVRYEYTLREEGSV